MNSKVRTILEEYPEVDFHLVGQLTDTSFSSQEYPSVKSIQVSSQGSTGIIASHKVRQTYFE